MKIYFINSKKENCGVYQYGLRVWDCIKSSKLDVKYFEIENLEEFYALDLKNVDILFFNWIEGGITGPFAWYNLPVISKIKNQYDITTVTIMHTPDFSTAVFDYYVDQDTNNGGFTRPLYEYDISKPKVKNDIVNIGSFGFAGYHKGFDDIVRLVNDQYDEAVVNLHITNAYYGDPEGIHQLKIIEDIKNISRKPGIQLNITSEFYNNEDMLDFVRKNDLIILAYKGAGDISAVPDYVISTNTPIAVSDAKAFRHVYTKEIDISLNKIKDIIDYNLKTDHVKKLRESWSRENTVLCFENLMNIIYENMEKKSYAQVFQDLFVFKLIGSEGFFLDLGAGWDHSGINSNTLLLEEKGWNGICVDANPDSAKRRKDTSIRASVLNTRIPDTGIKEILDSHNAPKVIDYLSIDIEPFTIIALENFPFGEYDFKVMTFEHDFYAHGSGQKDAAYKILSEKGYVRLCNNVNVPEALGIGLYFEDWWINPKYFSEDFIARNTFSEQLGSYIVDNIKN